MSMIEPNNGIISTTISARKNSAPATRPVAPWMQSDSAIPSPKKHEVVRRYSAATIKAERSPAFDDLPANPSLPEHADGKKTGAKMKKSETFYAKFVKNVLSSGRRSSKDTR